MSKQSIQPLMPFTVMVSSFRAKQTHMTFLWVAAFTPVGAATKARIHMEDMDTPTTKVPVHSKIQVVAIIPGHHKPCDPESMEKVIIPDGMYLPDGSGSGEKEGVWAIIGPADKNYMVSSLSGKTNAVLRGIMDLEKFEDYDCYNDLKDDEPEFAQEFERFIDFCEHYNYSAIGDVAVAEYRRCIESPEAKIRRILGFTPVGSSSIHADEDDEKAYFDDAQLQQEMFGRNRADDDGMDAYQHGYGGWKDDY